MSTDKVSSNDPAAIAKGLSEAPRKRLLEYQEGHVYSGADFPGDVSLVRKGLLESKPIIVGGRLMKRAGHNRLTPLGVAVRGALKGGGYANETK